MGDLQIEEKKVSLSFLIIIVSLIIATLYSVTSDKRSLFNILKPFTMLTIIALAVLKNMEQQSLYGNLLIAGFVFSIVGDIFLLDKEKNFSKGLLAFLIAHLFFIAAFNLGVNKYCGGILFPVLLFDFFILKKLLPKLERYKLPVISYLVVISVMLYSAINSDRQAGELSIISIGAILFIFSDSVLALNKFNKKIKFAEPLILFAYFVAQMLFAFSI